MNTNEVAIMAVSQMFTQAKADITQLEARLWASDIDRLGCDALIRFAEFWMSGEAGVIRAPRVQDFRRYVDATYLNAELAFEELYGKVGSIGPYADPKFNDLRLHFAVVAMGGWAQVCVEMPLMESDFKFKRYKDRFLSAWESAQAKTIQNVLPQSIKALGLCSSPLQLKDIQLPLLEEGDPC